MMDFKSLQEIPEGIRQKCRVIARVRGRLYYAESYAIEGTGNLRLNGAICDTSERIQGLMIEPRLSVADYIIFDLSAEWSLRPMGTEEQFF